MKKGLLLAGLFITMLFAACSKENSVEQGTNKDQVNTWSFSVGSNQYSGTIDTTYIETFSSLDFLTMEGFSGSGTGQILLSFGGTAFQVGEYPVPLGVFFYAENGDILYEANINQPNFRVVVTEISNERAIGTFSGTVQLSATGDPIEISNGRFNATR